VDGALYSTGDSLNYSYAGEALLGNAILWDHIEYSGGTPMTYYVAVEVNAGYVDNVFDRTSNDGQKYLTDVGWSSHTFKDLLRSDQLGETGYITFACGTGLYQWRQDLIEEEKGAGANCEQDPFNCEWTSLVVAGTPPPGIQTASSLQWNMLNAVGTGMDQWDVTLGNTDGDNWNNWKSPDETTPLDSADSSPLEYGYGSSWYDLTYGWEWLSIYEMSFDVSGCTDPVAEWKFGVNDAHASPAKEGWSGCTGDITIIKDVGCDPDFNCTTDFEFTTNGLTPSPFTLDDPEVDDGDGYTDTQYFGGLDAGVYDVTEVIAAFPTDDWELQTLECYSLDYGDGGLVQFGSGGTFHDTFAEGDDTVRIDLRTCESLVCTFGNAYSGTTDVSVASLSASSGLGGLAALSALGVVLMLAGGGFVWARRRAN
jgi:hypothetical protein